MLGSWSSIVDPIQLAEAGAGLSGELPLHGLARLVAMCRDDDGSVTIDLQFERNPIDGRRSIRGTIDARVNVVCQRCMESMTLVLSMRPRILVLNASERDELAEGGNALVVERPITLGTLIEDELLLSMPMVPMHAVENCGTERVPALRLNSKSGRAGKKQANPFAVLATLKRSDR